MVIKVVRGSDTHASLIFPAGVDLPAAIKDVNKKLRPAGFYALVVPKTGAVMVKTLRDVEESLYPEDMTDQFVAKVEEVLFG